MMLLAKQMSLAQEGNVPEFQQGVPVLGHCSQQDQRKSLEVVSETAFFRDENINYIN